jgi:alanine racemase
MRCSSDRYGGHGDGKGAALRLANSAGICLGLTIVRLVGPAWRFTAASATKPSAYRQVAPRAEVMQRRSSGGRTCSYGATWTAADTDGDRQHRYADGYLRCFAGKGSASFEGKSLPLIGRVSMDLVAVDVSASPELSEGDWVTMDYDLPNAAEASGLSQYELLTGLSERLERYWI